MEALKNEQTKKPEEEIPNVKNHNAINDLYSWEAPPKHREMKQKIYAYENAAINEPLTPIRGQDEVAKENSDKLKPQVKFKPVVSVSQYTEDEPANASYFSLSKFIYPFNEKDEEEKLFEGVNTLKDNGNYNVKLGAFDTAIMYYTQALALTYKEDPVVYANRALCFLKLKKYDECIEDCNRAIALNMSYTKAYYYMMQAYESLGDNLRAFEACKFILHIGTKDNEVIESYERIKNKLENYCSK